MSVEPKAAGGLAPNFDWFFVFRALVGLGEAAIAPAAISLIADMFPPHRRGRAVGAYLIGATIGSALSSIIPGWIVGIAGGLENSPRPAVF